MKPLPRQSRLLELLEYEPNSGILRWRTTGKGRRKDRVATNKPGDVGYCRVGIDYKRYLAHRIIWKMMTGKDPAQEVDHVDGDPTNNRWDNLREATSQQQKQNSAGYGALPKGVSRAHSKQEAYCGRVEVRGKRFNLGTFSTAEEASKAVDELRRALHGKFFSER